jgi:phage terminase large subunit GpA-like protein
VYRDERSGLHFWRPVPKEDIAAIESPIWRLWQQGTMYHWTWQCPHCEGWFVPRFRNLKWPEKATPFEASRAAFVQCPHNDCGGIIEEKHKARMNETGVYVAPGQWIDDTGSVQGDAPESHYATFWVSGLASPFVTFGERAEAYLDAVRSGDSDKIQTAINAGFGEMYAPGGGQAPDWKEVAKLRSPYKRGERPAGVVIITCGVDVQKNRLVYIVRGWGARGTSWLLDYDEIWGDTAEPGVWSDLSDFIENQRYGGQRIDLTIVDSGYRPDKEWKVPEHIVYEFCRRHQRIAKPSKGRASMRGPLSVSRIEVKRDGKGAPYSIDLVLINTDWGKSWVHERVRWPIEEPGAFHLYEDAPEDYCMALVSEARIAKPSGHATWVSRSRNNHAFDAEVMAYIAGYLMNAQRIPDGYQRRLPGVEANRPASRETPEPEQPPPAATQQPQRGRARFSFGTPRR